MNFCTLFDSNYISKGLALYLSISKYTDDFVIYVMAMDRKSEEMLTGMNLPHIKVECIENNMSPELEQTKSNRSRAEYCWTCGSYVTDLLLHKYNLPDITYLDSDLMFFSSPKVIFDELERKSASVGLAPHFIRNTLFGKYCVQYVYFKHDENGVAALTWWKNECLKWCYSKLEDGKYGDQKYLDYMPEKFMGVVDIENRGAGIAYWNIDDYKVFDNRVQYKKQYYPLVFFHYSGVNISIKESRLFMMHTFYLSKSVKSTFFTPYAELIRDVFNKFLGENVTEFSIMPLGKNKYRLKSVTHFLHQLYLTDAIVALFMRLKYRDRKSPYSER